MGLEEHIKAGAQLTRNIITNTLPTGSGSINLGSVYGILRLQNDIPARLRLYDTEESRDNISEISRPFGVFPPVSTISLVADFSMSSAGTYTIAPAVFGMCSSSTSPTTFYRLETTTGQPSQSLLSITRYLMEDSLVIPDPLTFYTINNRRTLTIQSSTTMSNDTIINSGTLSTGTETIPQTFLMISASLANTQQEARVRLYATSSAVNNTTEKNRPFATEPSESVMLLVDAIISGSDVLYFSPKIFGANLETMGDDLSVTATSLSKITGKNEMYYYIQNLSGFSANPEIKFSIYSLED
jgi:hypothetical protein